MSMALVILGLVVLALVWVAWSARGSPRHRADTHSHDGALYATLDGGHSDGGGCDGGSAGGDGGGCDGGGDGGGGGD
jgi:hypothetical protein